MPLPALTTRRSHVDKSGTSLAALRKGRRQSQMGLNELGAEEDSSALSQSQRHGSSGMLAQGGDISLGDLIGQAGAQVRRQSSLAAPCGGGGGAKRGSSVNLRGSNTNLRSSNVNLSGGGSGGGGGGGRLASNANLRGAGAGDGPAARGALGSRMLWKQSITWSKPNLMDEEAASMAEDAGAASLPEQHPSSGSGMPPRRLSKLSLQHSSTSSLRVRTREAEEPAAAEAAAGAAATAEEPSKRGGMAAPLPPLTTSSSGGGGASSGGGREWGVGGGLRGTNASMQNISELGLALPHGRDDGQESSRPGDGDVVAATAAEAEEVLQRVTGHGRRKKSVAHALSSTLDRSLVAGTAVINEDVGLGQPSSSSSLPGGRTAMRDRERQVRSPGNPLTGAGGGGGGGGGVRMSMSRMSTLGPAATNASEVMERQQESAVELMKRRDPRVTLQHFSESWTHGGGGGAGPGEEDGDELKASTEAALVVLRANLNAEDQQTGLCRKRTVRPAQTSILQRVETKNREANDSILIAGMLAQKEMYKRASREQELKEKIFGKMMTENCWKSQEGRLAVAKALQSCSEKFVLLNVVRWHSVFVKITEGEDTMTVDMFLKARGNDALKIPANLSIARFMNRQQLMTLRDFFSYFYPAASITELDWMVCFATPTQQQAMYEDKFLNSSLSDEQVKEAKTLFKHYDRTGRGTVSIEEVVQGFDKLGYSREESERVFVKFAPGNNPNAMLSESLFLELMRSVYYYPL